MAIKWGSTKCTAIKWGSTNCTQVKWGSTVVFPDGYSNGTLSEPLLNLYNTSSAPFTSALSGNVHIKRDAVLMWSTMSAKRDWTSYSSVSITVQSSLTYEAGYDTWHYCAIRFISSEYSAKYYEDFRCPEDGSTYTYTKSINSTKEVDIRIYYSIDSAYVLNASYSFRILMINFT